MRRLKVLPEMECEVGCGECCGIVPVTEQEYRKVLHVAKAKGIVPKLQGATCPYYQEGTCSVYDARPFACRLFGHVEEMTCFRGHNVNIPEEDAERMVAGRDQPKRLLHEVLIEQGLASSLEELMAEAVKDIKDEDAAADRIRQRMRGLWSEASFDLALDSRIAGVRMVPG
jgi:uncharacterized protein